MLLVSGYWVLVVSFLLPATNNQQPTTNNQQPTPNNQQPVLHKINLLFHF